LGHFLPFRNFFYRLETCSGNFTSIYEALSQIKTSLNSEEYISMACLGEMEFRRVNVVGDSASIYGSDV
jgi:hypothetical protein